MRDAPAVHYPLERKAMQKYNKKNEQRKFATRLLLVLLDCYCNATAVLLVIVFPESRIRERKGDDLIQFIVHHTGVIVRIYIAVFLPISHLLNKCPSLVVTSTHRGFQRGYNLRFFVFNFCFLCEDTRIRLLLLI